jgi:hypothetical protein
MVVTHGLPEVCSRCGDLRSWSCEICKTSIPGSNPGGASKLSEEIERLTLRRGPRRVAKRELPCVHMFRVLVEQKP